jgi:hypothetical protein
MGLGLYITNTLAGTIQGTSNGVRVRRIISFWLDAKIVIISTVAEPKPDVDDGRKWPNRNKMPMLIIWVRVLLIRATFAFAKSSRRQKE